MNKINIKKRNGVTILCVHSLKNQQLNHSELELLKAQRVEGLLPANALVEKNKFTLVYNITGYLPLRDYLYKPIDRQRFGFIIAQFIRIFQEMREQCFSTQNLLLDLSRVMIHSTSDKIAFIFVPIQYYNNQTPIKSLFVDIAHKAAFSQLESTDYVRDYMNIIQRGVNFSVYELDEYIRNLNDQVEGAYQTQISPPEAKPEDMNMGYDDLQSPVYDGLGTEADTLAPYLIREDTGERIPIPANPFRIGRDPAKSDYAISTNRAISSCHATLSVEDNRYYITDMDSLNHTYVDDYELTAGEKKEIFPGTIIDLADERFIFEMI